MQVIILHYEPYYMKLTLILYQNLIILTALLPEN